MRQYLFACFIFVLVDIVSAQNKRDSIQQTSKSYIAVSVGAAIPQGNYALKDITVNGSGFANTGTNFEASIVKIIKRRTGIILMYRNQSNNMDQSALSDQYAKKYPTITWQVNTTSWKINAFMAGSYSSFPLGQKKMVSLDLKLLLGIAIAKSPQINAIGQQGGVSASAEQLTGTATAFAYCVGLGLKVEVVTNLFILFHADYLDTNPTFENVTTKSSAGTTTTNAFGQNMGTINFNLGLAYRID